MQNFDFRPEVGSPLVGAAVLPPLSSSWIEGGNGERRSDGEGDARAISTKKSLAVAGEEGDAVGDAGAYQHDDPTPWVPGCTYDPAC